MPSLSHDSRPSYPDFKPEAVVGQTGGQPARYSTAAGVRLCTVHRSADAHVVGYKARSADDQDHVK